MINTNKRYCLDACPLKFTESGNECTSANTKILSYNFNVPKNVYTNAGTANTGFTLTSTIDGLSGYPAIHRGIHFDNSKDAYLEVPSFVLNHTFSVHSWILVKTLPAAGKVYTLFSVDRNVFTSATSAQHFTIDLNETGNILVSLYKDTDSTSVGSHTSTTTVPVDNWRYVLVSVNLDTANYYKTKLRIHINNAGDESAAKDGIFNITKPTYKAHIGNTRVQDGAGSKRTNHWNGYIYEFHFYQEEKTTAFTDHYNHGSPNHAC